MIRKISLLTLLIGLACPRISFAGENLNSLFHFDPSGNKFGAHETTLDFFGSTEVPENKGLFDGDVGIGLGVNYFFTHFLGAGADTGVNKIDWPNHINASLIGRYPITKWSLAPYMFVGFGREFHDNPQWTYHFGGGVDYRLNRKLGVFLDVRATRPDVTKNFTLWRLGVRWGL